MIVIAKNGCEMVIVFFLLFIVIVILSVIVTTRSWPQKIMSVIHPCAAGPLLGAGTNWGFGELLGPLGKTFWSEKCGENDNLKSYFTPKQLKIVELWANLSSVTL